MKLTQKLLSTAAAVVALASIGSSGAQAGVAVSAEIVLLMDVSGSVDPTEFGLQQSGYAQAFQSLAVQNAVANAVNGVAVTLVQWANGQAQSIGWTHLQTGADSFNFGKTIGVMARAGTVGATTALGDALFFGRTLFGFETGFADNGFDSLRQVIDVSGDGATNVGTFSSSSGRTAALGAGVDVINGIAILGEVGLLTHYQTQVIGGLNGDGSPAFVLAADSFADFQTAITQKLAAEVSGGGIPEPMSMALFGLGLAGMGIAARRRRR